MLYLFIVCCLPGMFSPQGQGSLSLVHSCLPSASTQCLTPSRHSKYLLNESFSLQPLVPCRPGDCPSISPSGLSHTPPPPHVAPLQPAWVGARGSQASWLPPNATGVTFAVTGPLSELQIGYVCREVLQVRTGVVGLGRGRALLQPPDTPSPPCPLSSPGTCLSALTEEDTPGHQGSPGEEEWPRWVGGPGDRGGVWQAQGGVEVGHWEGPVGGGTMG